ncbi:MAG TPA: phosphotransferase [Actinophytocola sp.]|nr:phosphotransferase [Actinophytocola sp.]
MEQAVEERRVWLLGQLEAAAPRFGIELVGEVVNTYDMRSVGSTARDIDRDGGHDVWLRVVVEDADYQPACRWTGNVEANAIHGVPKPKVLRWYDWTNTDRYLHGRRLRGEVMTLAPGSTIAPDSVLFDDPKLPESWWNDLDAALVALAAHPVDMDHELGAVQYTINGVRAHLDVALPEETFADLEWTTAHADLHWGNIRGPELCILDWESWRPAPAGYDAATLYCTSLLHPPTAERLRTMPVFATRSGQIALVFAAVRYLWVVGEGSDIDRLEQPLRGAAVEALTALGVAVPRSL